jgi:hypothetical protein
MKNDNSEYGNGENNESGLGAESKSTAYGSTAEWHFFHRNGDKMIEQKFSSDSQSVLNEGYMNICENGTSVCKYELLVQQRPIKAPDGCAVISSEDLSWPYIKSRKESTVISICVPAVIGTIKLDTSYLEKMDLINLNGRSKVSFVSAGEGTNVAIFTDNEFEGDGYVLSGNFVKQQTFLHHWKRSSNDNVKSVIIHSTFSKKKSGALFPSSLKACDCLEEVDASAH